MSSSDYDWKNKKKRWKYKGDIDDPEYMKDRSSFFKENGNGWWRFKSNTAYKEFRKRYCNEKK